MKHVHIPLINRSFTVELPRIGRRRGICATVLCSLTSATWIAAPLIGAQVPLLPDADLSAPLIAAGILLPGSVGWLTLVLMEFRILRDGWSRSTSRRPAPRVQRRAESEPVRAAAVR